MYSINDMADQCCVAVMENSKMQEQIRTFICEEQEAGVDSATISFNVADVCTDFRAKIEPWLNTEGGCRKTRTKRVNNVINDISRISRELIGVSIRCASRKGGHLYVASEPKPRATRTVAGVPVEDLFIESMRDEIRNLEQTVKEYAKILSSPESAIDYLSEDFELEEIAKVVLEKMKAER